MGKVIEIDLFIKNKKPLKKSAAQLYFERERRINKGILKAVANYGPQEKLAEKYKYLEPQKQVEQPVQGLEKPSISEKLKMKILKHFTGGHKKEVAEKEIPTK